MKPLVYVCDLTHDSTVVALEGFPLGIGYIVAYAKKHIKEDIDLKLFKLPNDVLNAIDNKTPDILALSFFPWNKSLSNFMAEYYKKINPEGIVIFGGSAISFNPDEQKKFLQDKPFIDAFVLLDGEYGFLEILKKYLITPEKKKLFGEEPLDGTIFFNVKNRQLYCGKTIERPLNIDEIPSPYLIGLMDQFFPNQVLTPLIQATRGCPFTCGYCWAGNGYNGIIRHFSLERVCAELEYIAEHRKNQVNRRCDFVDSNFGMYATDEKIADKIVELQERYDYPGSFYSPCGKNNKDRVLRIIKKIKNAAAIVSVQSTDVNVQKNVYRQPIKINEYREIVKQFHDIGVPVETEIITGLPGETIETHLRTIKDVISMGMDEIHPFTLMFLEGTDLNQDKSQEKYNWDKRFRILPRNFGQYRDKNLFEVETVGVGSNTFSFEDYLFCRSMHVILRIVLNHSFFTEYVHYLGQNGVDLFSFCMKFHDALKNDRGQAGKIFAEFMKEIREEIWDKEEEIKKHYSQEKNFKKLLTGEAGENLLGKYKVLVGCEQFDIWCDFYAKQILNEAEIKNRNDLIKEQVEDLHRHIMAKASNIISPIKEREKPVRQEMTYDILSWIEDRYSKHLSKYRMDKRKIVEYRMSEETKKTIDEIYVLHSKGKSDLWKAISSRYYLPSLFRKPSYIDY